MARIVEDFTAAADENTPSPLAQLTDQVAGTFATRMVNSLKSSFLGMQSVAKRNEQRLQGDVALDLASQVNPLLGAALGSFPAVRKRLEKNPELIGLAAQYLGGRGPQPGNGHEQISQSGSESSDSMSNY